MESLLVSGLCITFVDRFFHQMPSCNRDTDEHLYVKAMGCSASAVARNVGDAVGNGPQCKASMNSGGE